MNDSTSTFDVVSVGSATRDVYLESQSFIPVEGAEFQTGQGICVNLGSKVEVDGIHFTTGGSAVNAAVTFALQGLRTGCVSKVGEDSRGRSITERLKEVGVATEFIVADKDHLTAYSIIIHSPSGERSIFVYRGATSYLHANEVDVEGLMQRTKWMYITHLSEESAELFPRIMHAAAEANVSVALNPGSTQLKMGKDLVPLLSHVDVLFLNREEASLLTGVAYEEEHELFQKLDEWVHGVAVMTKGPEGVTVSDGKTRWDAGALSEPEFIDRTGAGDAFGAGFTTALVRGGSIEDAIALGSANATGVIGQWGANHGLLKKGDSAEKFGVLDIKKTAL